jgi:N6-adenosine-specific RNA methylase IME4
MMFSVMMADPPWSYDDKATGGSMSSGAAQVYAAPADKEATMPLADIMALPVQGLLTPNAILALWVTTPLKFTHGGPTMGAWGFRYVTTVYWHKAPGPPGMGRYFRGDMEELLIGIRGSVKPFGVQVRNVVQHPRTWDINGEPCPHSSKPEPFRRLIEQATAKVFGESSSRRNLELFGRRRAPGWTVLGYEVDGLDIREAIRREAVRLSRPGGSVVGPVDVM